MINKRTTLSFMLFWLLWSSLCTASDFSRLFIVEFPAQKLPVLLGKNLEAIRLVRFDGQGFAPIPFQIDKRDRKGQYVFSDHVDFKRNTLQGSDEFCLQAQDLGLRAPVEHLAKVAGAIEIRVSRGDRSAFGYIGLLSFPLSTLDYIRFDAKNSGVVTPHYTLAGHPRNPSFYSKLILGGVDHIDRVKLRAVASLLFGKVRVQRTEEDIRGRSESVIDGPVRVVYRIRYSVRILANIHSPTIARVTKNYKAVNDLPNDMNIPFNPDLLFTDMHAVAAYDFNPDIAGAKIYCPKCNNGFEINGRMDDFEFADLGLGSRTFSVCSDYGTFMMAVRPSPETEKLQIGTNGLYEDNIDVMDPPEDIPGKFGMFGYRLTDLHKVPKGYHRFNLALLFPKSCPGKGRSEAVAEEYFGAYGLEFNAVQE